MLSSAQSVEHSFLVALSLPFVPYSILAYRLPVLLSYPFFFFVGPSDYIHTRSSRWFRFAVLLIYVFLFLFFLAFGPVSCLLLAA